MADSAQDNNSKRWLFMLGRLQLNVTTSELNKYLYQSTACPTKQLNFISTFKVWVSL
jgi:hypothetical protein